MVNSKIKSYYQKKLPEIVKILEEKYRPERIVLFGSMLNKQRSTNDIDLFLIKKTNEKRLGKRANHIFKLLPFDDIPIDFLVYTPDEVKHELSRGNVFIAEILNKGKTLYQS